MRRGLEEALRAVTQPEKNSKNNTQNQRRRKKPASLWDCHEHHDDETNRNDEPDGMAREVTSTIRAVRHNPRWLRP